MKPSVQRTTCISHSCRALAALFFVLLMLSCAQQVRQPQGTQVAADPPQAAASAPRDSWPRQITSGTTAFTIYQPQLERWEGNRITARAAVAALDSGSAQPAIGTLWFTARTDVNRRTRMVTLSDFNIPRVSFPGAAGRVQAYQLALIEALPAHPVPIALDRLEADLQLTGAASPGRAVAVQNSVPKIIFCTGPALLVLIDGKPVLREVSGTPLSRVINTAVLLVSDRSGAAYYLRAAGTWLQAPVFDGHWTIAQHPASGLDTALSEAAASGQVNLLDTVPQDVKQALAGGTAPAVFVSTVPAALLRTTGDPQFQQVPGTNLSFAQNSTDAIFKYYQQYYVLISGRWFSAQSLQGPWTFVPGSDLPRDFSLIPPGSPKGYVLASVPGTAQARQAVIDASVPQTAAVSRTATTTVRYDGAPQFRPVAGTSLTWAINASLPVICVSPGSYYLVDNGVWYFSSSPQGPWTVAVSVPAVIYTIPPDSPVHYVTYVYAYGAAPGTVYTGFTPGYYGTVVAPDNTIVYGTGYMYPAWAGAYWYPAPYTYYYYYDIDDAVHVTHDGKYIDRGYVGDTKFMQMGDTTFARNDGDLYAARDGNVYKRELGGWKQYDPDSGDWNLTTYSKVKDAKKIHDRRNPQPQPVQTTAAQAGRANRLQQQTSGTGSRFDRTQELDHSYQSRLEGERRVSDFRSGGGLQGGGFGGRGFGGGGFRGGRR